MSSLLGISTLKPPIAKNCFAATSEDCSGIHSPAIVCTEQLPAKLERSRMMGLSCRSTSCVAPFRNPAFGIMSCQVPQRLECTGSEPVIIV